MPILKRRPTLFLLLILAFLFRLGFGLCSAFQDLDSIQIYLLGLKFYTTRAWPYFGPDVVWGEIQIPGALQGVLVGFVMRKSGGKADPKRVNQLLMSRAGGG